MAVHHIAVMLHTKISAAPRVLSDCNDHTTYRYIQEYADFKSNVKNFLTKFPRIFQLARHVKLTPRASIDQQL